MTLPEPVGSLATGDYHPGTSDLDLVAVVEQRLTPGQEAEVADIARPHVRWAHGELYRQPMSGIVRADLLRHGVTVLGPHPAVLIPAVSDAELAEAARDELSGYWSTAVARRHLWLQDVYVDLGLTTLARVEATLTEGRLITKTEAISRLDRFGVPPALVAQIAARRRGEDVPLSAIQRARRAAVARQLVGAGITRLVGAAG